MPTYVITGARGGIGLEYVNQLSRDPSNTVIALVRSTSTAASAALSALESIRSSSSATTHIIECDVSSEASIAGLPGRLSAALGPGMAKVDFLINNAATLQYAHQTSLTLDAEGLDVQMNTNVLGPARIVQVLLPFLGAAAASEGEGEGQGEGQGAVEEEERIAAVVANITSGAGSLGWASDGRVHMLGGYSISKAALNMLTVQQAKELKSKGIVAVAVDPGHVKTASGGLGATVEVEDSARSILHLLAGLNSTDTGRFFLYNGTCVPW
ncbi:short chain dehydrogenase/reductase SDR [Colletotrichum orchidophilum]|uniref:Short chain dehydrogenase/reductase SDR n=1 Tax=Colletotrichum orchidophilum TaxID=1209926 RepID=A0A1G4AW10_9PEZI|nr:short chain dehydrogenase/reductase SDR [Colletotrichum orchidophilum]OHE93242.1 short chain dehydrogenase/reductase SDR [Colletotrichum orchidophilum]